MIFHSLLIIDQKKYISSLDVKFEEYLQFELGYIFRYSLVSNFISLKFTVKQDVFTYKIILRCIL